MSRRIVILSIAVFLITSIFAVNTANASWVGLSTDELIQKSDIILVGEIVSKVGEEKRSSQVPSVTWVTNWKVKVFYYIKGNQEAEELTVTTPARSSLTYRLDQWGKTVLLFLPKRGND